MDSTVTCMQYVDANMEATNVVVPVVEHLATNLNETEIDSKIISAFALVDIDMVFNPAEASLDVAIQLRLFAVAKGTCYEKNSS
ncbi:hypothetical protein Tco_0367836 [Tanacetum coccineum]